MIKLDVVFSTETSPSKEEQFSNADSPIVPIETILKSFIFLQFLKANAGIVRAACFPLVAVERTPLTDFAQGPNIYGYN